MHGRTYFKHGPWFEWRLPGLGSSPLNRQETPDFFRPDYNVPFKSSIYNVRDKLEHDAEVRIFSHELP